MSPTINLKFGICCDIYIMDLERCKVDRINYTIYLLFFWIVHSWIHVPPLMLDTGEKSISSAEFFIAVTPRICGWDIRT